MGNGRTRRSTALRRYERLRARTPIRRTRLKARSPRRIARETAAEIQHKRLVREMRICAMAKYAGAGRCTRLLVVAHLGHGGMGQKLGTWLDSTLMCADDPRTGRLGHHQDFDDRRRIFKEMPEAEREAFAEREIHLAREFVAGRQAVSA